MQLLSRTIKVPVVGVAAVLAVILAYQAGAGAMLASPTSVAVVRLSRLMENLQQRADLEADLASIAQEVEAEHERRKTTHDALKASLNDITDPIERQEKEEEVALVQMRYSAWATFVQDKLDVERSLALQDLYRSIREQISSMASIEGYDLVVVDDSSSDFSLSREQRVPLEIQVQEQMRSRRVLYANTTIDITDDLVDRMNNAHKAN